MKIMVVGGTGLLGYHTVLVGLSRGHKLSAFTIDDVDLNGWYPADVQVITGDVFSLSDEDLQPHFIGYDALVYAVGPDDRVVPRAPSYDFFHEKLVNACVKTVTAAKKAGVKRCVILNSYFAYFDRIWPEKKLSQRHPYIRCRIEQAEQSIAAGGSEMSVMILELPYIFGTCPGRIPFWKDVFLDRFAKGRTIFFPKGGTNMIAVQHVGEAVIGALEYGRGGQRYVIGDENHPYQFMLKTMMDALGTPKKIIRIPRFIAALTGIIIERQQRAQGLEGGLHARYLMRDIMSSELYFDPSESIQALRYGRGGLEKAIAETAVACYPK